MDLEIYPEGTAMRVRLIGRPERTFMLHASPDLEHWTPLVTNTLHSSVWDYLDGSAASLDRRFYRAAQLERALEMLGITPTNRFMRLTMAGEPGRTYVLEASPDLRAWTRLFTNTPAQSPFDFTDSEATNSSRRFYRAARP